MIFDPNIRYSLDEVFANVFTSFYSRSIRYPEVMNSQQKKDTSYQKDSYLGIPCLMPFTIKGGSYQNYDDKGKIIKEPLPDFRMPLSTLVEVSRAKEVSYTPVSAGKTTIKEVSGFQDWEINIQGVFLNEQGHPQNQNEITDQMKALAKYEQVVDSLEVTDGWLFDIYGIYRVFVDSMEVIPIKGQNKISGFSMNCKSDEPYEIELKHKQ